MIFDRNKQYHMDFIIMCESCARTQRFKNEEEVEENLKVHHKHGCWNCFPSVAYRDFRSNVINFLTRRKEILYDIEEVDLYIELWKFGEYKVYWMLNQIYDE